jgi:hypothetical protein
VKISQVPLAHQGQRPGGLDLRGRERVAVEFPPLEDADAGQPGDPRAMALFG